MKVTSRYITTVANDARGWGLIDELRKDDHGRRFRFRGRHPNRKALMAKLGRVYSTYAAHDNDINLGDLLKLRENEPNLTIRIYYR